MRVLLLLLLVVLEVRGVCGRAHGPPVLPPAAASTNLNLMLLVRSVAQFVVAPGAEVGALGEVLLRDGGNEREAFFQNGS